VTLGDEEAGRRQRISRIASVATPSGASSRAPSARKGCQPPVLLHRLPGSLADLQADLKRVAAVNSVQIFFNRPADFPEAGGSPVGSAMSPDVRRKIGCAIPAGLVLLTLAGLLGGAGFLSTSCRGSSPTTSRGSASF